MIGISFEVPNKYDVFLSKILKNVDFEEGVWKVVNDEVLSERGTNFFNKEIYLNDEFKELIKTTHYPIFLTLQLYNKSDRFNEIKSYDDYFNSDCKLLLIIVDNTFIDVYSKDKTILKQIKVNAKENSFINIKDIENKEDFSLYY